ncbi:MAG TPA: thioredoxin domain-containing protein [Candidatus Sulfotelmatobacter sp.]|nr:thioredoxin domain-containing protein [Candidatus Sulfotelmatobacter sp.]
MPDHAPSGAPANRLAAETSPYLLQHAHDPVDWYAWGPEALARAVVLDRPIFLSIGYAACHWCHVMAHESFRDPATAAELNEGFVAVKVDREERPDLDALYMDAVQALTGQGGWPMSLFLTPAGQPFYGGTYFPDQRRHGMPAFRDVLAAVDRTWHDDREGVLRAAARVAEAVAAHQRLPGGPSATDGAAGERGWRLDPAWLPQAVAAASAGFDPRDGGWGGAPKFPAPMLLEALLMRAVGVPADPAPLAMVRRTLDAMADGGIHDQLGGGFARYSTDARWLVPHFEKMLYDNAQLARVYLHAWQLTGHPRYREVAESTLDYLARELALPDGLLAASQDADTDGREGATYVWTADEIGRVIGPAAPLFAAAYDVQPAGNWEGRTILHRIAPDAALAERFGLEPAAVGATLADARDRLLEVRRARSQPARDDKALAAWNGLALAAFAEATAAWGRDDHRLSAERAAAALLDHLVTPDGRLHRSWKDGRARHDAVLEDYADLAEGLLALYQATFEERWFSAARDLLEVVLERFAAPEGGFFDTADDHETLLARPRSVQDNATPSGNAMAATALLRLAALSGEARYRDAAEAALRTVGDLPARHPQAFAQWLVAWQLAARSIAEVAIVGQPGAATARLIGVARAGLRPWQVLAAAAPEAAGRSAVALLRDRPAVDGGPTAYVCRGFVCLRPVSDPAELAIQLASA